MSFAEKYSSSAPIKTYFFELKTPENRDGYVYLLCSTALETELFLSMRKNMIPRFAVVIAAGEGSPDEETRFNMERFYGFKHVTEEA